MGKSKSECRNYRNMLYVSGCNVHEKSHSLVALGITTITLAVSITMGVGESNALASEKPPLAPIKSNPTPLLVIENKIYGNLVNRPLSEVLDDIDGQLTLQYQASQHLLEHPISGSFDGISIMDTLKKILRPFDYFLVTEEMGNPTYLFIFGTKIKSSESADNDSSELPPGKVPMLAESRKAPASTKDERFIFESFDSNTSLPPEFQEHSSRQSSDEEFMGPSLAVPTDQDLPEFEPFISATGPEIVDIDPVEFLEFEPYHSEHGPLLPGF